MKKAKQIFIDEKAANKFNMGYPLITKEVIASGLSYITEGDLVKLYVKPNKFVATGYVGFQNKGFGWILSTDFKQEINQTFFESVLKSALEKRKSYFRSKKTTAFRVFNAEGDGIGGLTIDYYEGYFVFQWYSRGIYEFRDEIMDAFKNCIEFKGIYEKLRFDESGKYIEKNDFVIGSEAPEPLIVKENDVNFAVYLNDGAMVGVFLDQREVRRAIKEKYVKNKTVLNTFSYTGAFSVFAALGGASKTTSVDLANRSYAKTIEQFSINDIDYESHEILIDDVFDYFKYSTKKGLQFDVVILDPPSYAKSKNYTFSAHKDYKGLLKNAISMTCKNGIIVASTNCATLTMDKFKGDIAGAFTDMGCKYEILEQYQLPDDFRSNKQLKESNYLKVCILKRF